MNIVTPEDFTRVRNQRPISDEVVQKSVDKYLEAYELITGTKFDK